MDKRSGQIVLFSCALIAILLIGAAGVGGFVVYRLATTASVAATTAVVAIASSMTGIVQMENVLREGNSEQRIEVLESLQEYLQVPSTELPPKEFLEILLPALEEAEKDEDPRVVELCNEVRALLKELEAAVEEPTLNANAPAATEQESELPENSASQNSASQNSASQNSASQNSASQEAASGGE